ncbi:substrate-binding domain-containing protein [Bacillus paranthracis]
MKKAKKGIVLSSILAISMFMGACSSNNASTGSKDSDAPAKDDGKRYVAIISKGFQHQFWQAVKKGAEQAADEYKVNITFVGPETEAQVDKQVEMLRSTLDKKPDAIGFAALDSKGSSSFIRTSKKQKRFRLLHLTQVLREIYLLQQQQQIIKQRQLLQLRKWLD